MNVFLPSTTTSSPFRPLLPLLPSTSLLLTRPVPPLPRKPLLAAHLRTATIPHLILARASSSPPLPSPSTSTHWLVVMERPPGASLSKADVISYYVDTLAKAVGSVSDARARIYDFSWETYYGFCCDVDEDTSRQLASLPGVLSVRPDTSPESSKDCSFSSIMFNHFSKPDNQFKQFTPSGLRGNGKHWLVRMEKPGVVVVTKIQMVDYYVKILKKVLHNEKDAQVSIYNISWEKNFGFCCHIDEDCAEELADVPGVLSVSPDLSYDSENKDYGGLPEVVSVRQDTSPESSKDYSFSSTLSDQFSRPDNRFKKFTSSGSGGNGKHWLVQMEKPGVEVVTKAQMVDYYVQILTKVLRNEEDAQASIYNISWEQNFGFCCHIGEDCAEELADVPGVLSVSPDLYYDSENKDYGGTGLQQRGVNSLNSLKTDQTSNIKTKRLFVRGLSFYTSERTLRAAFEGFGELVEVKVIMDKISKRSKGYAFIEYTTEAAAAAALKGMNGKIINGWMIVVDVARSNPPRTSRDRTRSFSSEASST